MATMTAPDIAGQLEQAQREARGLRTDLDRAEGELAQAVEAKDYRTADELKQRAADLRPHVLLAEASVDALRKAQDALQEHACQERATAVEKERQEQAQAAHAAATAQEKEAVGEAGRLLAEAKEHVGAARQSLRAALAAESRAGHFAQQAYQAAVDAGWQEPSAFGVGAPNHVEAAIDSVPLLRQILQATE